jgi:glycosyltransferase involved in cell wall biosynthesis
MRDIEPRITIITAVYNGAGHIEECIESILGQTYTNLDYVIIDGGSTDGTPEIVRRYADKLHYFISEKDNGIYHAWNKGLAQAKGDWIAFVGADDRLWSPDVVANTIRDLETAHKEGIRYVYGRINLLSPRGEIIDRWGMPWAEAKKDIYKHMTVTHCCAFHHRSLFGEYGVFDESFRIIGDYEFLLRGFTRGGNAFFADRVFAGMKVGGISANLRMKLPLSRELIRAKALNNIPSSFHDRLQVLKARLANLLISIAGVRTLTKWSDLYRTLKGKPKIWSETE